MTTIVDDNTICIEKLVLGQFSTNTYIVVCKKTRASVLIDAPADAAVILEGLAGTKPQYILLTHSHLDHIGALAEVHDKLMVPLAAHALAVNNLPQPPEIPLENGNNLYIGDLTLEVIYTPGHTPGSLCFKVGKYLFSGDTLFDGGPGRTKTPADFKQIVASITGKLFTLPDDTPVYPGHGNSTTIKKERKEFADFSSRPHDANLCGDIVWLKT